jgi:hypothetical protein
MMRAWWIEHSATPERKLKNASNIKLTPHDIERYARMYERRVRRAGRRQFLDQMYRKNGLNGPRAVARRCRQMESRGVLETGTKA